MYAPYLLLLNFTRIGDFRTCSHPHHPTTESVIPSRLDLSAARLSDAFNQHVRATVRAGADGVRLA